MILAVCRNSSIGSPIGSRISKRSPTISLNMNTRPANSGNSILSASFWPLSMVKINSNSFSISAVTVRAKWLPGLIPISSSTVRTPSAISLPSIPQVPANSTRQFSAGFSDILSGSANFSFIKYSAIGDRHILAVQTNRRDGISLPVILTVHTHDLRIPPVPFSMMGFQDFATFSWRL